MPQTLEGYHGQAQAKGWLVYRMDQSYGTDALRGGPWDEVRRGYCAGLAARWIELRYAGRDFPYDRHRLIYEGTDEIAANAQAAMHRASAEAERTGQRPDQYSHWTMLARHFHMSVSPGLRNDFVGEFDPRNLISVVSRAYGCYGISITTREMGKPHAIAVQHATDNRFHVFDANWGHFSARYVGGFAELLKWYYHAADYDRDYYWQIVIGIRPRP